METKTDNQILREFFQKANEDKEKQKNYHLKVLGLSHSTRVYENEQGYGSINILPRFDDYKRLYYKDIVTPINVTDEEYAKICEIHPLKTSIDDKIDSIADNCKTIKVASVFYIVWCILSIIIGLIYGILLLQ